jgi:hypothetical protein
MNEESEVKETPVKRARKSKYAFRDMAVGDTIEVEGLKEFTTQRNAAHTYAFTRKADGIKFSASVFSDKTGGSIRRVK